MSANAFITDIAAFLPNEPVSNDRMDLYWGKATGVSARIRRTTLNINGIKTRYYAFDPAAGRATHTNAQLAAEAVRRLNPYPGFSVADIACLACGTATADQLAPGHASMVHGELACPPLEVASTAGVCGAGISALRYAVAVVAGGLKPNAVATGSEQVSSFFRCRTRPPEPPAGEGGGDGGDGDGPARSRVRVFSTELLNWMLSDGAGAAFVAPAPRADGLSLRVDGIECRSFAGDMPLCMYSGALKRPDGSVRFWREFPSAADAAAAGCFAVQQDIELLNREIMPVSVGRAVPGIVAQWGIRPQDVDWFVPHYSSDYFRKPLFEQLRLAGFEIPYERWFTNLPTKGNIGSAAAYVLLEELLHSGRLRRGQRLLCYVPESGRFSVHYVLLSVV